MTNQTSTILINKIKARFMLARFIEALLFAIGVGLLMYGLSVFTSFSVFTRLAGSVVISIFFLIAFVWIRHTFRITNEAIAQFVSLHHPQVEYSTDLLLADDAKLNRLERLQKERTRSNFAAIAQSIKVPFALVRPLLVIFFGAASAFLLSGLADSKPDSARIVSTPSATKTVTLPPELQDFEITVSSPAYMRLKTTVQTNPELHIQEGATVRWTFNFSDSVKGAFLIFSGNDSIAVNNTKGLYSFTTNFNESGFYQLGWVDQEDSVLTSDYYRIEVRQDAAPVVEITNPPQFLEVKLEDDQRINVTALLKDDWGITGAHIIATVSKGSGESVKFREEKLSFTKPTTISGKAITASLQIDLRKMGMEPGDELYFYVVGQDNMQPVSNRTRTETHFIVVADTATIEWAMDDGLGVDLMPEYFRSQRQIIIDTEKLLRERKAITKQEFNARSNELGYDQKLLRLKYGEFLGEEFESGVTQEATHVEGAEDHEEDPLAAYSHKHDVDEEHQEVVLPDKKDGEKEDPLAAFVHAHDDSETATFFEQSIRTKLKAALSVMWDAELYLRLYEPDKSLPFQYKALKLLKEISNDSRIYVHKVGFDPPPVKEDKRLTGELKDVYSMTAKWSAKRETKFVNTRQAIRIIERILAEDRTVILEEERFVFQNSGNEVAAALLENPTAPLRMLTLLKSLSDGSLSQDGLVTSLQELQKNLIQLLPAEPEAMQKNPGVVHSLERSFTEAMEKNK